MHCVDAIGVDSWQGGDRGWLDSLIAAAPANRSPLILDPGYSTAKRHGGFAESAAGGALRTILSYMAHSRLVAYLDDDNWWSDDHLAALAEAIQGHDWAYSLRWFVDAESDRPLCVDTWESVGPGAGVFARRFGGFVDPSCLLIDKLACEPVLRLWCHPLADDPAAMTADRTVFDYLRREKRWAGTNRPTAYYRLSPSDMNHQLRLDRIAIAADRGKLQVYRK
jgi:hypothetical protein